MIHLFLWGLVVGGLLVASSVSRTLAVHTKDIKGIVLANVSNGIFYYISVHFVIKDNLWAYIGSIFGGLIACLYLALKD